MMSGMGNIDGHFAPQFAPLAEALDQAIATDEECGAAIAIDIDGEPVVDIWGGHTDAARTTPWTADTIVNVWSSTKNVTALAGLMLIDRGSDRARTPRWPRCGREFGANGKQHVQFAHLLTHSSGLSAWEQPVTPGTSSTGTGPPSMLAAQAPWWEPGTATGLSRADPRAPDRGGGAPCHRSTAQAVRRRADRRTARRGLPDRCGSRG